jgi:hypothetical protein
MIGIWTVTPSSGWVTLAFLYRRPMGRIKRSYFTGLLVKSGPTNVGFVIILFQPFLAVFFPVFTTCVNAESAFYISAKLRGNKHKETDLEYLKRTQTFKSGKDKKTKEKIMQGMRFVIFGAETCIFAPANSQRKLMQDYCSKGPHGLADIGETVSIP